MSAQEADRVAAEKLPLCTMHDFRRGVFDLQAAIQELPDPVFLTIDVDVFDWSVVMSTGTPEPGGLRWGEVMDLLENVFFARKVVACDVVELAYAAADRSSPFAVAKLVYRLIALRLAAKMRREGFRVPERPAGAVFT